MRGGCGETGHEILVQVEMRVRDASSPKVRVGDIIRILSKKNNRDCGQNIHVDDG